MLEYQNTIWKRVTVCCFKLVISVQPSQDKLTKPKESAECHQTLSLPLGELGPSPLGEAGPSPLGGRGSGEGEAGLVT